MRRGFLVGKGAGPKARAAAAAASSEGGNAGAAGTDATATGSAALPAPELAQFMEGEFMQGVALDDEGTVVSGLAALAALASLGGPVHAVEFTLGEWALRWCSRDCGRHAARLSSYPSLCPMVPAKEGRRKAHSQRRRRL